MIPYFIVCMYKKAYKEAGIAFVYDLYYQLLGPALTFYVFHWADMKERTGLQYAWTCGEEGAEL